MTYGGTFLKGNYELPRGPVKLSRERWEMLADSCWTPNPGVLPSTRLTGLDRIVVDKPRELNGVIFLPAEYVPEQVAQ